MDVINRRSQARNEKQAQKWGFDFANKEEIENADTNIVWSAAGVNNQEAITAAQGQVFGQDKESSDSSIEEDKQVTEAFYQERAPFGERQDNMFPVKHSAAVTMKVSDQCLVVVPGSIVVMQNQPNADFTECPPNYY